MNEPKTYEIQFQGIADLMWKKPCEVSKRPNETHDQLEERLWEATRAWPKQDVDGWLHYTKQGQVCVPPFAFKNGLEAAAKWLSMSIPGEGKKTFTKRFASGVMVLDPAPLVTSSGQPVKIQEVRHKRLFVPSGGDRGMGKRVYRLFPLITDWAGSFRVTILDEKISESVLRTHVEAMGGFIGLGAMRVQNGGTNGRFVVEAITKC